MRRINCPTLIVLLLISSAVRADPFFPSWHDWRTAVSSAAKSPATWAPLSAAAIVVATDSDQRISEWAAEKKPVFGSYNASDNLREKLEIISYATLLLSPQQQPDEMNWIEEKGRRGALQYIASRQPNSLAGMLKNQTERRRPNDHNGEHSYSLPSGHAADAFAYAALSNRNLDDYNLNEWVRSALKTSVSALAGGVAWARVESQSHYPSDVLIGAAIGNFVTSAIYNAFLGASSKNIVTVHLAPTPEGVMLNLAWRF